MTTLEAPRTYGAAVRDLAAAQKTSAGVPAYLRYVNRPLGRRAAALAYVLGATPNQVTVLSGLFSLASIVLLVVFRPSVLLGVLVAVGLVVGYALDSADGQLARLLGGGSLAGEWLDHVVDAARMPAVHLAVLIALFRFGHLAPGWLLVPLGYALAVTVTFFSVMLVDQMRVRTGAAEHMRADGLATGDSLLRSLTTIPVDFGAICLVFLLWGFHDVFMAAYVALFVISCVHMAVSVSRKYRELQGARD